MRLADKARRLPLTNARSHRQGGAATGDAASIDAPVEAWLESFGRMQSTASELVLQVFVYADLQQRMNDEMVRTTLGTSLRCLRMQMTMLVALPWFGSSDNGAVQQGPVRERRNPPADGRPARAANGNGNG